MGMGGVGGSRGDVRLTGPSLLRSRKDVRLVRAMRATSVPDGGVGEVARVPGGLGGGPLRPRALSPASRDSRGEDEDEVRCYGRF